MHRAICTVLLATLFLTGCGDSKLQPLDMGGEDGSKISLLIEEINESKGTVKKMARLFPRNAPLSAAEANKYLPYSYSIVGKPTVNGTEGTATVSIYSDRESKELAQKEWAFIKEADTWKVRSAPLR